MNNNNNSQKKEMIPSVAQVFTKGALQPNAAGLSRLSTPEEVKEMAKSDIATLLQAFNS